MRPIAHYRHVFDTDPKARMEVRDQLTRKNKPKWDGAAEEALKSYEAYQDLVFWKDKNDPNPVPERNRLGGQLSGKKPDVPPKPTSPGVIWPPNKSKTPNIQVKPDGTIVHTDSSGGEIEDAHEHMHAIFDDILYTTRDMLEKINTTLEARHDDPAKGLVYTAAVAALDAYVASLAPGGSSPHANAFNFVNIDPLVTNEGFIVSVRIELDWKNPFHSTSTIKVP